MTVRDLLSAYLNCSDPTLRMPTKEITDKRIELRFDGRDLRVTVLTQVGFARKVAIREGMKANNAKKI